MNDGEEIQVKARPMSLVWIWPDAGARTATTSWLDPADRMPKPYEHMSRWERAVLRLVLTQVLADLDEFEERRKL